MIRCIARVVLVPPLVVASAVGGAIVGAGLTIGWLLVRREERICWLSGDVMP